MAEHVPNWELIAKRLLILAQYDMVSEFWVRPEYAADPEFLTIDWLVAWYGEEMRDYVEDELGALDLLMSNATSKPRGHAGSRSDTIRFCTDHKKSFSLSAGCDECRKVGWCAYYGKGCPC